MASTSTYLTFNGNCEEAFNFYRSVFGGEFLYFGKFDEMVSQPGAHIPEKDRNLVMHVSLPIGDSVLMGSDCGEGFAPLFKAGNNFSISIRAESKEEADRVFSALARGGEITLPLNETFWGDYFGMLTDQFGINWMMSFNPRLQEDLP